MSALVIRPLVAGEESLFASMPDPLPELRQVGYADGIAGGGYAPDRTWVALRDGRVLARAAWLLPPGATGEPWLERFETTDPEVGAALLRAAHEAFGGPRAYHAALPAHWRRRPEIRDVVEAPMAAARLAGLVERGERLRLTWIGAPLPAASGRHVITRTGAPVADLVASIAEPDILTGKEIAKAVGGVDLARAPQDWITGDWLVARRDGVPVGLAGVAGDACFPLLAYLGVRDPHARPELLAEAVRTLAAGGAREVVADVDAYRVDVVADLERTGFRQIRARVLFAAHP